MNEDQHTNLMRKKSRYILILSLIWFSSLGNKLQAHEYWLAPYKFNLAAGEALQADLKVGQNFEGESLPFITNSFDISNQTETVSVTPRFASFPALNQAPPFDGLNIISYRSKYLTVNYNSQEKFQSFLREEGLDWVLDKHRSRQLPSAGFTEAYRRFVKSLVNAGSKDFSQRDRRVGLLLELVLQDHPFTQSEEKTVQLFWNGKPFPDVQVTVFQRTEKGVSKQLLRTDNQGLAKIDTKDGGVFLINSVHMIEPDETVVGMTNAVWESLWASMTFEVPAN